MPSCKIRLAAVRVNANMTNDEWARALGVTPATVSSWELGRSEPKLSQVRQMSELSGIPIDLIFFEPKSDDIVGEK